MFLFPEEGAAEGHGTVIQLYQFQLGAGQGDVAGENPHVFEVGFYDGFLDLCPVDQDVIAGEGDFTLIDAEATGGVALGVQVAEEDLFAQLAEGASEVYGGGVLIVATFLVGV